MSETSPLLKTIKFHASDKFFCRTLHLASVAVFSPLDLIDETGRRWTFAACFILLANSILSGEGLAIVEIITPDEPMKYKWVTGIYYRLLLI